MEAKLVVGIVVAVITIAAIGGVAIYLEYLDPLIAFMIAFMLFIILYVLAEASVRKEVEKIRKLSRKNEERAKPEIEVDMPLKEYKLNYWKRTRFILRNKGKAHARDVEIELSDVMSAELIGKVDLDAGEEKELEVVLKPKEMGEVPLREI